jgi:carbamoyl-phosphate synthase large subunit
MKSTGEVMGIGSSFGEAFAKAQLAAGVRLPAWGEVLITVCDEDKKAILPLARDLADMGFTLHSTRGTRHYLQDNGIPAVLANRVREGNPNIIDEMRENKFAMIINTPNDRLSTSDSFVIRRKALEMNVPCFTALSSARAAVEGIRNLREGCPKEYPLQG